MNDPLDGDDDEPSADSTHNFMNDCFGSAFFYAVMLALLMFSADLATNGNTLSAGAWWTATLTMGGLLVWTLLTGERTSA
ncbi:hypothetical protein [Natrinema sp. DC36]|jgi:hypothetical protein|uniref:hypothetical protein n=1 Tax=Natrinema sp. DC36 TaxID=2878680 RepID=UPI001CF09F6B|nr:hypothetical protein [Natrinema sp. DC36]